MRAQPALPLCPVDAVEECVKFLGAAGVYLGDPGYSAFQMGAEVGDEGTVLGFGAGKHAVVQDGFQSFELRTWRVAMLVDGDAGDSLACVARHDAGFCLV